MVLDPDNAIVELVEVEMEIVLIRNYLQLVMLCVMVVVGEPAGTASPFKLATFAGGREISTFGEE